MPRQPNGRPKIKLQKDGNYHSYPTVGTKPSGDPLRKHVKRRTATEVAEELDEIKDRVKQGHDVTAPIGTYAEWYDHWLENIVKRKVRAGDRSQNTYDDYESLGRIWIKPYLGQYRLVGRRNRLEPEHLEEMYAVMAERGLSKSYIRRAHVAAHTSQKIAYKRGKADRVVADLVDAPENAKVRVRALKLHEAQAVIAEALSNKDGLAARWALGLLLGPRSGEACGFRWSQTVLDPDAGDVPHILPEKQIQRFKWRHGCGNPVRCNKTRLKQVGEFWVPTDPCRHRYCPPQYRHGCASKPTCGKKLAHFCPAKQVVTDDRGRQTCARHTRTQYCKPCADDCTDHASTCPDRIDGGLREVDLKTEASSEAIALPEVVVKLLRAHREQQIRAFADKGRAWSSDGFLFPDPRTLGAMDNKRDWDLWQALLERAKVGRHRLHAARHTTGTFLRATGHDMKMIKEVLRHADPKVSDIYTEESMDAKHAAVERIAALLVDGDLTKILGAKRVTI